MSADNFLGIYKQGRKYIGRNCWSECDEAVCKNCENRLVFVAKSLSGAVKEAEQHCKNIDETYEYGYRFLNL